MRRLLSIIVICTGVAVFWLMAQPSSDPMLEGYRATEVASVSDAMEQMYGQQTFLSHPWRE